MKKEPPPIVEPENSGQKRKRPKKVYSIECRYVGDSDLDVMGKYRDWQPYRQKYATERDRDQALKSLNRSGFEYRASEDAG